jgi:hypothetical protein
MLWALALFSSSSIRLDRGFSLWRTNHRMCMSFVADVSPPASDSFLWKRHALVTLYSTEALQYPVNLIVAFAFFIIILPSRNKKEVDKSPAHFWTYFTQLSWCVRGVWLCPSAQSWPCSLVWDLSSSSKLVIAPRDSSVKTSKQKCHLDPTRFSIIANILVVVAGLI